MPVTSKYQIQTPNVIIWKLIIRNNSSGLILKDGIKLSEGEGSAGLDTTALEYVIIDNEANKNEVNIRTVDFYSLNFIEDMSEPHMSGSLVLVDQNNIFDQLGINTAAEIEVWLRFIDTDINGIDSESIIKTDIKAFFNIINITNLNDPVNQDVVRGSGAANYINIKFTTKEGINSDFNVLSLRRPNTGIPTEFIGPISSETAGKDQFDIAPGNGAGQKSQNPELTIEELKIVTIDEDGNPKETPITDEFGEKKYKIKTKWDEKKHSSFFSQLVNSYNKEWSMKKEGRGKKKLWSHATDNDIWFKPEYFYFPSYRFSSVPSITQFINYIKTYAVLKNRPNVVDFMFWEDLWGFSFQSITKLVEEQVEAEEETPFYFRPDPNPNNIHSIFSMEVICDVEPADIILSGALTTEYIRIKPYWNNPFRNALGSDSQFSKTLIKYDYETDIGAPKIANALWTGTARSPFNTNESAYVKSEGDFNTNNFRMSDEIYGFYDTTILNAKKTASWNFLDINYTGFTYTFGTKDYDKDGSGLLYKDKQSIPTRLEEEFWQSQYDFCELSGGGLYIVNNIKRKLQDNRKKYADAKKTNDQWKFYLENICCERKIPSNFFALLTDAKKIYGGDGITFTNDSVGIYAYDWVEVEFWPKNSAEYILKEGQEIVKFINDESFPFVFVKPSGALEGHGVVQVQYDPKSIPDPDPTPAGPGADLYYTKDTRAYNLSELLNSTGLTGTIPPNIPASLTTAIKECQMFLASPGLSSPRDRTKTGCKTSYPDGFSMLPAGGFRFIGSCSDAREMDKTPLFFGKIVQMNVIPREIMQTIVKGEQGITGVTAFNSTKKDGNTIDGVVVKPTDNKEVNAFNASYLFLFDSVNAHDGLCDSTCAI